MNARLKGFGLGSKRKSSANNPSLPQQAANSSSTTLPGQLPGRPGPPSASNSVNSLPGMNHPGAGGRPPSYTPGYPPTLGGRTTSPPMPQGPGATRTPPTQVMGGPPPINTAAGGYPQQHGPPPMGGPPLSQGGGPPQYGGGAPYAPAGAGGMAPVPYTRPGNAVEVEGAGRSKSQLIVGIDFVSNISICVRNCSLLTMAP